MVFGPKKAGCHSCARKYFCFIRKKKMLCKNERLVAQELLNCCPTNDSIIRKKLT